MVLESGRENESLLRLAQGALASNEQIFGADEQNRPRDQSDQVVAPPYDVACSTTQSERTPASHVSPCGRGLYLGFNEQSFGADKQILGQDQGDQVVAVRPTNSVGSLLRRRRCAPSHLGGGDDRVSGIGGQRRR